MKCDTVSRANGMCPQPNSFLQRIAVKIQTSLPIIGKFVLGLLLTNGLTVRAADYYEWDHPTKLFDAQKKNRTSVRLEWRAVEDARAICSKLNIASGYGPIKFTINACSILQNNVCTIVTNKETSMHTLGHEFRHCFQGAWHGNKIN